MTQPHYIDRDGEPVSNRYKFDDEIAWLQEAARYFSNRPTGGEDAAHWSNVYNAENANKIASRLDALSPAPMEAVDRAYCQKCGGKVEGWICQSCDQEFREDDAGNLVFDDDEPSPAIEAVAWRVKDYADGWILFHNEAPARKSGEARNGALVQALAVIPTEGLGSSATPIPTCDAEGLAANLLADLGVLAATAREVPFDVWDRFASNVMRAAAALSIEGVAPASDSTGGEGQ